MPKNQSDIGLFRMVGVRQKGTYDKQKKEMIHVILLINTV